MLFTSPSFLFTFLPLVTALYYLTRRPRWRNGVLVAASCLFYFWSESFALGYLLALVALTHFIGGGIARAGTEKAKRVFLAFGVAMNLTFLAIFKYFGFFAENLNVVRSLFHLERLHVPEILLPVGISFFTFHSISYLIDTYRSRFPERPGGTALTLYFLFFPQLIAGPIVRYFVIAPSLKERSTGWESFAAGVRRFIAGLAKKVIIADCLAGPADRIFSLPPEQLSGTVAWVGLFCYTLQIYFDFSGYSDMAIGLGRMFGFSLPENFDYPYISRSLTDFWRRWHITLSSWLRDYVYIPLGGSRFSRRKTFRNLLTVFALCGLWHGASWNFVLWGLFHGIFLIAEKGRLGNMLERVRLPLVRNVYAMLIVMTGWVLFRCDTLAHTAYFVKAAAFGGVTGLPGELLLYLNPYIVTVALVAVIASTPAMGRLRDALVGWSDRPGRAGLGARILRQGAVLFFYSILLLDGLLNVAGQTQNSFIYFRF